jgi:hypothetical protein
MRAVLCALLLVTGCIVGEGGTIDRGGGSGGGGGNGDGTGGGGGGGGGMDTVDGGAALACTGAVYESCTDAAQCTSGQCKAFGGDGIQVCTQTCTPGDDTTCPQLNGQPATCNNMGICKPPGAIECTR